MRTIVPAVYSFQPEEIAFSTLIESGFEDLFCCNVPSTHKVVITFDIGEHALSILEQECTDTRLYLQIWSESRPVDRNWLLGRVKGAAGLLVTNTDKVDDELLDAAGPSLKVVSTMSVGYQHVSLPALAKRSIKLGYTPDVLADAFLGDSSRVPGAGTCYSRRGVHNARPHGGAQPHDRVPDLGLTTEHLLAESHCTVPPHTCISSVETRVRMACLAARNLLRGVLGEPLESGVDLGPPGDT